MPIPDGFDMGPHHWHIIPDDHGVLEDGGRHGQSSGSRKVIALDTRLGGTPLLEVLLHEVLHASLATTVIDPDEDTATRIEELVVRAIAPNLLDALRRNPDLVKALVS